MKVDTSNNNNNIQMYTYTLFKEFIDYCGYTSIGIIILHVNEMTNFCNLFAN